MQWTRGAALDGYAKLGLIARVLKAVGNASVFLFLMMPLVVLSNCGGTLAKFTGYEALQETSVPTPDVQPMINVLYGPDWWVLGVMVFAAAGLGSAWRGGIPRSLVGGAAAIGGLIALQAAIGYFSPPSTTQEVWSPNPAEGAYPIGYVFASVIVLELASIAARGRSEAKRGGANKGDCRVLGCFATWAAILLGLGVLAVVLLTLATGGCKC